MNKIDFFDKHELQPANVRAILAKYEYKEEYSDLENLSTELAVIGWTFDYGLDAIPFELQPTEKLIDEMFARAMKMKRLPLIHGSINHNNSSSHMSCILPVMGEYWVDGEIGYNSKMKRYEDIAQDLDGKCYLVVAK